MTEAQQTTEDSRNDSGTANSATTRQTDETTPLEPALNSSTDGTTTRFTESNQPARSAADTKELEFRRKRDRLLSLNFQPSQKIALREDARFPEEYKEHVRKLSKYLEKEPPKFEEADYYTLIPCMGKRIGSTDKPDTLVPYVRVIGLTNDQAIKAMNVVLCKSKVRSLYHPHIRICFDTSKVDASASDDAITVYGSPTTTLCGTLIVIKRANVQRTVTVGGLITVADRFYAITSSHIVPSISEEPTRTSSSISDAITIDENDYDDDVEPALVIERETEESGSNDGKSWSTVTSNPPQKAGVSFGSARTLGTLEESGQEWSLIRIKEPWLKLPNSAANEDKLGGGAEDAPHNGNYISSVAETPSGMTVTVLAGASGQVKARLSPNEAYTRLPSGTFVQTWTLSFEHGTGKHFYNNELIYLTGGKV